MAIGGFSQELSPCAVYESQHAPANGDVVVTHEIRSEVVKKIKIPDVCDAMEVESVGVFQMLSACGVRFVLERSGG